MYLKNKFLIVFLSVCFTNVSCSFQKCYVVTKNNDIIKGKFRGPDYSGVDFLNKYGYDYTMPATPSTTLAVKNDSTQKRMFINVNSIKSLNVVNKKNEIISTYIFFNTYFWKLLVKKGNLGIYMKYHMVNSGWIYGTNDADFGAIYDKYLDIAIFSDTVLQVQIYSGFEGNLQLTIYMATKVTKQLLPLINTRYNLSLTKDELLSYIELRKPLQNQTKLFNFILDKEAKLEKMQEGE